MKRVLLALLSVSALLSCVKAVESMDIGATVPVTYSCRAEGHDLVVRTNAVRILREVER